MKNKRIEKLLIKLFKSSDKKKFSKELRVFYKKEILKFSDKEIKLTATIMVSNEKTKGLFDLWLSYVSIWGII